MTAHSIVTMSQQQITINSPFINQPVTLSTNQAWVFKRWYWK